MWRFQRRSAATYYVSLLLSNKVGQPVFVFLIPFPRALGYRTLCSTSLKHARASLSFSSPLLFSPSPFISSPPSGDGGFALLQVSEYLRPASNTVA